jgi:hypothetical protein
MSLHRVVLGVLLLALSLHAGGAAARAAPASIDGTAVRESTSLAGEWTRRKTTADVTEPPSGQGEVFAVPRAFFHTPVGGSSAFWFERQIAIPEQLGDRRVYIDLRGARNRPTVYVDGQRVGTGSDGWTPSAIEITAHVRAGATHRLTVRLQDSGAFLAEGVVRKADEPGRARLHTVLNPVGGYEDQIGFTDSAWLRIVPRSHVDVDAMRVVTSTRQRTIEVAGKVKSASPGDRVIATVLDGDREVLRGESAPLVEGGDFAIQSKFDEARFWSPEDPHLYALRLVVRRGDLTIDVSSTRFGFKEVWCDGPDFYLNGVKRRLLASSTWPRTQYEDPAEIRDRVRAIRATGTVAFRLHTAPWQEAWLDAADEVGLMIISEAAVYTDGDGKYAYDSPVFWENYRKHVAGLIERDRNRASVVMFSLGNEILFMGNQSRATELPRKLGDLARFARELVPHIPLTYEADIDPDGAYDVVGLHYPHEMPRQRAYPNAADWLDARKDTEASGGMLGQQSSTGFLWDRKKPLYIGEFLWTPQRDYSCGTIWFGDEAFTNRDRFHGEAQARAWVDQSIAYRRAGVTGICPWTAFGFGGVANPDSPGLRAQVEWCTPVAAFWSTRGLRFFGSTTSSLQFDVFNDSAEKQNLTLRLECADARWNAQPVTLELEPAGHRRVSIDVFLPAVEKMTDLDVESVLSAGDRVLHRERRTLRIEPRRTLQAPAGFKLVVVDPNGRWPGSHKAVPDALDPAVDVLLIAENATGAAAAGELPTLRGPFPGLRALHDFLRRGGRAVILEQASFGSLALPLNAVERPSTMTFPLDPVHPLLAGLRPQDLSFWAPNNFVTRSEILRPTTGGSVSAAISGGEGWMQYAPVVELPFGNGRAVVIQALAGEKRDVEPAAARLIQNAVDHLCQLPKSHEPRSVRVLSDDPAYARAVAALGIDVAGQNANAGDASLVVLHGGGEAILGQRDAIESLLSRGGTLYWHAPEADAFASLRDVIGGATLEVVPARTGVCITDRSEPLLRGVSRGDLLRSSRLTSWTNNLTLLPTAAKSMVRDVRANEFDSIDLAGATPDRVRRESDGSWSFESRGVLKFNVDAPAEGVFEMVIEVGEAAPDMAAPVVQWSVNAEDICVAQPVPEAPRALVAQLPLRKGNNAVTLRRYPEAESKKSADRLRVLNLKRTRSAVLPASVKALTVPAAIATWRAGAGRVVVDCTTWDEAWEGPADARRSAQALLGNLGASFREARDAVASEGLPLSKLKLLGESPYFARSPAELSCNSNATFEVEFQSLQAGEYRVQLLLSGTPFEGEYPRVRVEIDGKVVGEVRAPANAQTPVTTPPLLLEAGRHTLRLVYDNDAFGHGEDRNLVIRQVGFASE